MQKWIGTLVPCAAVLVNKKGIRKDRGGAPRAATATFAFLATIARVAYVFSAHRFGNDSGDAGELSAMQPSPRHGYQAKHACAEQGKGGGLWGGGNDWR